MEGQQQLVLSRCGWSAWLGAELVPSPAPGQLLGGLLPSFGHPLLGTLSRGPSLVLLPGSWAGHTGFFTAVFTASHLWGMDCSWNLVSPKDHIGIFCMFCSERKDAANSPLTACSPPCSPSLGSEQAGTCLPVLSYPAELACTLTLPFPLLWWVGDFQRSKVGVHWNCNPNVQIT